MNFKLSKILAIAAMAAAIQSARAVPSLQLDSPQGIYDTATETTVSSVDVFDLWALGKAPSGTYYLTAVVTPKVPVADGSFGSFKIGSTVYNSGNMLFGDLPNPIGTHDNLYPSYYAKVSFTFGSDTVASYNTQTDETASGILARQVFGIDMSGLANGFGLHFDLFNTEITKKGVGVLDKAPFSHDAEGRRTNVPDGGATVALLGLSFLGLGCLRRKS